MKMIFFASLLVFASCKKEPPSFAQLNGNNQMKAVVSINPGFSTLINVVGSNVSMGCSYFGGGTYIDGTNDIHSAIYISVRDSNLSCILSAGTYKFECEYKPDVTSQITPIYQNRGVGNPGSITFTSLGNHYAEGYFNADCTDGVDSVVVTGTFSGYFQ